MHTYEVHFIWQGKAYQEYVTTTNGFKARDLVQGRYFGAKITSVTQVG
jgi:hypothetical protein